MRDVMLLDQLGWSISLPAWRVLKIFGALVAWVLVLAGSFIAIVYIATTTESVSGKDVFVGVVLIDSYLVLASALRIRFGSDGIALSDHPFANFLQALDIPRVIVVASQALPKIAFLVSLELCVSLGAIVGRHFVDAPPGLSQVVSLLMVPLASGALIAATSTGVAARQHSARGRAKLVGCMVAVAAAGLAGVLAGALTSRFAGHGSYGVPGENVAPTLISVAAVVLAIVGGGLTWKRLAFIGIESWSRRRALASSADEQRRPTRFLLLWPCAGVLARGGASQPVARVVILAWISSAAIFGFAIVSPALGQAVTYSVGRVVTTVAFVTGLLLSDHLLRCVGPVALATQLRFAYEQGASAWGLAVQIVAPQLACLFIVLAPECAALQMSGVSWHAAAGISMTCIGAGLLSASLSTAARTNDRGEASGSPAAVIVAVAVSGIPVAVSLLLPESFALPVLSFIVVIVLGGALSCVRSRIVRRPLNAEVL